MSSVLKSIGQNLWLQGFAMQFVVKRQKSSRSTSGRLSGNVSLIWP
ncbi:hypothetical protein HMPREF1981_01263 [Bacteroides pyogenes F0041]|uniref:Uncharacterized protein n=1 Tax=Bacteroides pyogenes F0041 TaxID=1321819 RepID=U2DW69_9BACE|nr:hypothetical protein HMPREF1981_01263 [Bacteroides pyogenes F0041]